MATFGIGFVALAYEVLLTRLGVLYLGNTVSVFPLMLTSFLLGTGISAVLGTRFYGILQRHTNSSNSLFGITALMAGAIDQKSVIDEASVRKAIADIEYE